MRLVVLLFVAALAGAGVGLALAIIEVRPLCLGFPEIAPWRAETGEATASELPRAKVDQPEYDFGTMDLKATGRHEFVVRNVGGALLRLNAAGTSCRCTVSEIESEAVPPGGSTRVTVQWRPDDRVGPYEQTARLETNDPSQPVLTLKVRGRVSLAVVVEPPRLVFSQVTVGEPASAEAVVWNHTSQPLELTGHELADASTADCFDVRWEPVEPSAAANRALPAGGPAQVHVLTPADEPVPPEKPGPANEPGPADAPAPPVSEPPPTPRDGCRVLVTIKPGLPQGPFRQTIRLHTNLSDLPTIEIPCEGVVTSEIAVVAAGWDSQRGILDLGMIRSDQGVRRTVLLVVRGQGHESVRFRVLEVEPPTLRAEIQQDQRKTIADGKVTQTPLILEIPSGSPPEDRLGLELGKMGIIELVTTHPRVPQLRLYVRYAVE